MEPEVRKAPIRFYEIDLLRFIAALSVVFYHYTYRGYARDYYSPVPFVEMGRFTRYGYLGVELFFIISGYVVLLSAEGKTIRQFFVSRVVRLYPAFWVACTLTFLVKIIWGQQPTDTHMTTMLHTSVGQYVYNMTMLYQFLGSVNLDSSYWSLPIELCFYFLIALIIGWKLFPYLTGLLAGWLLYTAWAGAAPASTSFATLFFPTYAPYFVAGMLFYLLQQPQNRTWMRYGLLLASYALAIRNSIAYAAFIRDYYHDAFANAVVVSCTTSFFIIFLLITFRKLNLSRFSVLRWFGNLTYPLYLLHADIGFIIFHRLDGIINKYLLLGGLVIAMMFSAYLIHILAEKPFSESIKRHLNNGLAHIDQKLFPY